MLRRQILGIAVIAAPLSLIATLLLPVTAFASGGGGLSGGGGTCSDSGNTVGCTTGVGGSGETGTTGGSGATTTGDNTGGGGGSTTAPTCPNYVPYPQGGAPPAGENPNGAWYINTCAVGTPQGQATGLTWIVNNQPPPPPPPDPALVAAQAASQLQLASPTLTLSPAANAYVNFPEWLSINAAIWHPFTTSATACNAGGCTTAAATATPDYVTWNTGDSTAATVCYGPGTTYDTSVAFSDQSTQCSHIYAISSIGQPSPNGLSADAAFPITAAVTWSVTWAGPDGSTGQLATIGTQGTSSLKVEQIESVLK
jgi:hypothetical protein